MAVDLLIRNARIAACTGDVDPCAVSAPGFVAVSQGRIAAVGTLDRLDSNLQAAVEIDAEGRWLTPGLIDCHTHLVYAGDRAREFELRLQGASYEEIARVGGGIRSTVEQTRGAAEPELFAQSARRLQELMRHGVMGGAARRARPQPVRGRHRAGLGGRSRPWRDGAFHHSAWPHNKHHQRTCKQQAGDQNNGFLHRILLTNSKRPTALCAANFDRVFK